MCRTADGGPGQKSFKQSILDICTQRNDEIAHQVRIRIEGAVSDLHAADARYHVDCMANFMSPKSIFAAINRSQKVEKTDEAFNSVICEISKDRSSMWNSVELFQMYQRCGGNALVRRSLLEQIKDYFGEDVIVLSSPGLASMLLFKNNASKVLKLSNDQEDDQQDILITKLAKKICDEVKEIVLDKSSYDISITQESASMSVSTTLMDLLAKISTKLNYTPPGILIGNIVTNILCNHPTTLQLALGNLIRDSKLLINQMYQFRVTCSYDEILRFKKSAAFAATKEMQLSGIHRADHGLIQAVADNFDADISSQNGKVTTHALAMLITQPKHHDDKGTDARIPRISKAELSKPLDLEVPIQRFQGPKRVPMPEKCSKKQVLPLKVLCSRIISERRARELDFEFLNEIGNDKNCPEYNGFNTKITREQGQSLKPKTNAIYLPLIDMTPSDPDTMMTALHEAMKLTKARGQERLVFTSDQQLYRVALEVSWVYQKRFSDVVIRLGGMHMLMSFVGAVGSLMEGSGLSKVLKATFAGVEKMLSGKKFPQNVRAMRLVVEELLRNTLDAGNMESMDSLLLHLDEVAEKSKTSKLWVDCFIKPVFIMMLYVRAEREGDWPLHLAAVQQMLPYFFASGHVNYARYGLYYLRSMESLPKEELSKFMKGEHAMHHVPGLWNGIWSDMYIETTFMRYGHGPGGIIGITLKPETLKTWALSLHICSRLQQDIANFAGGERHNTQENHKEETKSRIASDGSDRESIREKLQLCIDPLDHSSHPANIVNIVSGRTVSDKVNVHQAVIIGKEQMTEYENGWPSGFYDIISKRVKTAAENKKHIVLGNKKLYDTSMIYSRVIGIQASSRDIDIENVLSHELAPVPTSMFEDSGTMRLCKGKSDLKNRLAKEASSRCSISSVTSIVLDGSAILWVVHWPAKGVIADFVINFKKYIEKKLLEGDVYLIFDRYREYSTKNVTRSGRESEASRVYQLTENMPLPSQKAVLTVAANKVQLMSIICNSIINDHVFHRMHTTRNKLVITGSNNVPTEIHRAVAIARHDVATSHEEADNIIAQQAIMCAKERSGTVLVLADDTDVFILLLYHYQQENITCPMIMSSPIQQRSVIDIKATVEVHGSIIPDLMAAHALSGCDTVPTYFGIGKGTVLKVLKTGTFSLSHLGCTNAQLADLISQSTSFMGACYSNKVTEETMSAYRYKIWAARFGKGALAPKLETLPPSTEAFTENVKRAHLQTCIWKAATSLDPPALNPQEYGYVKDESMKILLPTTVPVGVPLAPDNVLKLIKCNCAGDKRCRTTKCSCNRSNLPCTVFCSCNGESDCKNKLTKP